MSNLVPFLRLVTMSWLFSLFLYLYLEKIGDRTVLQDALRRALLSTPLVPYSAAWSAHDLYERARLSVCRNKDNRNMGGF